MPVKIARTQIFFIEDLVEMFKATEENILRLIESGELSAKQVGQEWIITREHLIEFLEDINFIPTEGKHGVYSYWDSQGVKKEVNFKQEE